MTQINREEGAKQEAIKLGHIAPRFMIVGNAPVRMLRNGVGSLPIGSIGGYEGLWLFQAGMEYKIPKPLADAWGRPKDSLHTAVCEVLTEEEWAKLLAEAEAPAKKEAEEAAKSAEKERLIRLKEKEILRRTAEEELKKEGKLTKKGKLKIKRA